MLAATSNSAAAADASSSLIPSTLMMEAACTSETSELTRATLRYIPEDGILHSHSREKTQILPRTEVCFITICEVFDTCLQKLKIIINKVLITLQFV
jgi:hypothetical protein